MGWWQNIFSKQKNYPEFWNAYNQEFKHQNKDRIVVVDCETTGLNPKKDKILSIGAVALHQNVVCVEDAFSAFVKQDLHKPETVAIHGIVDNQTKELVGEEVAIKAFLKYVGSAKIIGHHIQFDIEMLNNALAELQLPKLKNKVGDTAYLYEKYKGINAPMHKSLDDLCKEFHISKKDRHTALGDAFLTALVYQRLVIH